MAEIHNEAEMMRRSLDDYKAAGPEAIDNNFDAIRHIIPPFARIAWAARMSHAAYPSSPPERR